MGVRLFFLAVISLLASCASVEPTIQTGPDAEVIDGKLHRVDNSSMGIAYVDPGVDFSRFQRLLIDPLGVDNVKIIEPGRSAVSRAAGDNWELDDRDRKALQGAFADSMRINLEEKGDYKIVTEAAGDVLRISAKLVSFAPNAPRDDARSRSIGRTRTYSEGIGDLSISISFSDSETGEVLALVKDTDSGSSMWGVNNRVSNLGEVRFMFNGWARTIRARLDVISGH
jgi:hypothetical protein